MKKLAFLLSLLMLLLYAGRVWATIVPNPNPNETRLTYVKDGDQFFIRSEIQNISTGSIYANGYRWITLHTPYSVGHERLETVENDGSTMEDGGVFTVEATGTELTIESGAMYAGYYIKNVKSGLYVARNGGVNGSAVFLGLTNDVSQALVWGFRPVTDANPDNEFAAERFFIFTITESGVALLNGGWLMYDNMITPFYGGWTDGPAWFDLIPPIEQETDYVSIHLRLYQQAMKYGFQNSEGRYVVQSGIGGYNEDLVAEYNELMYHNTDDLIFLESKGEPVDWAGINNRLEALILKLETAEILYPVDGYYRFINAHPLWSEVADWRSAYSENNVLYWDVLSGHEDDPSYVWHITRKPDGKYRIQNLFDGLLLNSTSRGGATSLSTDENFGCELVSLGKGQFSIRVGNGEDYSIHPAGHQSGVGTSGTIVGWPGGADDFSAWRIMEVSEDLYAPYVEEMERKLEEAKGKSNFPPKDGYYRIISTYTQWAEEGHYRAVFADEGVVYWRKYTPEYWSDPAYIWHFTRREDGTYRIQNLQEGLLFTSCIRSGSATLTTDEDFGAGLIDLGLGQININVGTTTNGDNYVHPMNHANGNGEFGTICGFPGGINSQSAWRLVPADEEEYGPYVAAMEEKLENAKLIGGVQTELKSLIAEVCEEAKPAFAYEIPSDVADVTPTSYEYFWSNAAMLDGAPTEEERTHTYSWGDDGQGYAALIDEDISTHFHTYYRDNISIKWSAYNNDGTPAEGATPTHYHNLAMKLKRPVTNVAFQVSPRGNNVYNNPTKIDMEVSTDGIHWKTVFYGYDFFTTSVYPTASYVMGPFDLGGSYQYVRFTNYRNDRSGGSFFCFSELKVFEGARLTSSCQASTMDQTLVGNFLRAYSEANRYSGAVTIEQFDDMRTALENLKTAYQAFASEFADPSELELAILKADVVIQGYRTGDDIVGQYDGSVGIDGLFSKLLAAMDILMEGHYTKAMLETACRNIYDEIDRLEATRVQPEPDKWYQLVFPSQAEYDENPDWNREDAEHLVVDGDMSLALYGRVAAVMNGTDATPFEDVESLREEYQLGLWSVHEETIRETPEVSYFRFVPIEEGKYALQNKATGLYVGNLTKNQTLLSSTPCVFTLDFVGKGCTLLYSADYWTGLPDSSPLTVHFAWNGGNKVIGWTDYTIGTKSSIHIRVAAQGDEAVQRFTATADAAQAHVRLNDIKRVDGAVLYTTSGLYVEEDPEDESRQLYFLGLKQIEEEGGSAIVEAGHPFIALPTSDVIEMVYGTDFARETVHDRALQGTFQAKTLEPGKGYLRYDAGTAKSYVQVVGGAFQHNAAPYTAYLSVEGRDDLPESEDASEFDLLMPIRGQLSGTGITSLRLLPTLRGNVYDLAGKRVGTSRDLQSLPSGIYLLNGHKILIP